MENGRFSALGSGGAPARRLRDTLGMPMRRSLAASTAGWSSLASPEAGDIPAMTMTMIRGGRIADGTGDELFEADLLIENDRVGGLFLPGEDVPAVDREIDAAGCIVAPGFIDMHSHADWLLALADHGDLAKPYLEQGITTVVGGNCGFSPAPVPPDGYASLGESLVKMLLDRPLDYDWQSMGGFLDRVEKRGVALNLAELVGHVSLRLVGSATRRGAMSSSELECCLDELRRSFDEGAAGLSFGLGYDPGMYSPLEELEALCHVAAEADKPVTVHLKALSSISPTYPMTYLKPHNLRALREMLDIARHTGIRLQLSHFIFVGRRSWSTAGRALEMVEEAQRQGVDVMIDAFPYTCGNTTVNAPLPYWFLALGPRGYRSAWARARLRVELELGFRLVGFVYQDFQVMDAGIEGEEEIDGLTIAEIARRRNRSPFDVFLDLSERSRGETLMLFHSYSGAPGREQALETVLASELCLFETDALVKSRGYPNPAALGTFPRILGEFVRDRKLLRLEDAVRRMTSASAERFGLTDRGVLARGKIADVVVFDPERIADTPPVDSQPAGKPRGIHHVFANGRPVVIDSHCIEGVRAGRVLRT
jgi:N-acyl-D-amino-acid deacylase